MVVRWPNPRPRSIRSHNALNKITLDNRFLPTVGAGHRTARLVFESVSGRLLIDSTTRSRTSVWRFRSGGGDERIVYRRFRFHFEIIVFISHRLRMTFKYVRGSCFPRGRAEGGRIINSVRQQVSTFWNRFRVQPVRKLPYVSAGRRLETVTRVHSNKPNYETALRVSKTGSPTFRVVSNGATAAMFSRRNFAPVALGSATYTYFRDTTSNCRGLRENDGKYARNVKRNNGENN